MNPFEQSPRGHQSIPEKIETLLNMRFPYSVVQMGALVLAIGSEEAAGALLDKKSTAQMDVFGRRLCDVTRRVIAENIAPQLGETYSVAEVKALIESNKERLVTEVSKKLKFSPENNSLDIDGEMY